MLVDRYEADKFFDEILKITTEIDPILLKIDQVLEDLVFRINSQVAEL